jgi:photosystem II stability/assembly factor-like uncharacterized protein
MKRFVWFTALLTLLLIVSSALAQPWMVQFREWDREPTTREIIEAFDVYWADKEPTRGSGWKQFQRWRWFVEPRLDENGNFNSSGQRLGWQERQQLFPNNELDEANWEPLGPFDPIPNEYVGGLGRVNCMEQDPTNTNHMYAGAAAGGLWETWTGGFSWSPLTDHLPVLGVSDIEIDHTNPSILYMATGDADGRHTYSIGVMKSTDGGQSWNETGLNYTVLEGERISRVIMDSQDNQTLIAATSNGIYKTVDGGDSWYIVRPGGNSNFYHDLENVASDPDTWYAASVGAGVYRSQDNGETWSALSDGIPFNQQNIGRIEVEIAYSDPNQVYALYANNSNGFHGFYKSYNGGDSWTLMASTPNLLGWDQNGGDNGGQAWYDLSLAVNPQVPNEIYVGGVNAWKSTDGGADWNITGIWYYGGPPYVHADHHRHEFFIENDVPVLYSANDGGLYRTLDGGSSWIEISHGMVIQQIYRLGVYQNTQNVESIIFGNQDNGTKLKEGEEFRAVLGGDGMEAAIAPDSDNYMFAEVYYGEMSRSTNGGNSWQNGTNGIPQNDGDWVTPYIIDPNNPTDMWFGTNEIWYSGNRAQSWTQSSPTVGSKMAALAVAPSNSNVVYGVNPSGNVLVTRDFGDTWDIYSVPATPVTYVAVHPSNEALVYTTISGYNASNKVFVSHDYGETWANISEGLPNVPANTVAVHPYDGNHVYVGTDVGVFFSDDAGNTWQDWNTGLPNVIVNELEFHTNSNTLVAATFGRGIWSSEAEEVNVDPFLAIAFPNGGEEMIIGDTENLRWYSYGIDSNISIELNRDYPIGDWEVLFASTENDWAEEWVATGPMTANARIRVTSLDNPEYSAESEESFSLIQPSIRVLTPNGGEVLPLGLPFEFTWDSIAIEGNTSVEINRDYPDGAWETIVPSFPDPGGIVWIANGNESNNARIRVTAVDLEGINDISDDDFSILLIPTLQITSPTEAVTWNIGDTHSVTWEDNIPEEVVIEFVPTLGDDPIFIVQTASDGSYSWPLSEYLNPGWDYTIRVSSVDDPELFSETENAVSVELRIPDELVPAGGIYVSDDPVVFSWEAVPGASEYNFTLAEGPVVSPETIIHTAVVIGAEYQYPISTNGEYSWIVSASHPNFYVTDASETATFQFDATSVAEIDFSSVPEVFELTRVYPNPFNPETQIVIALPQVADLSVKVYNVTGQLVATLADGQFNAGYQQFILNGSHLSSGTYFLKVESPGQLNATHKLVLVK